jgi:hypothetical protein
LTTQKPSATGRAGAAAAAGRSRTPRASSSASAPSAPNDTFSFELFGAKIELPKEFFQLKVELPDEVFGVKIDPHVIGTTLRYVADMIDPPKKRRSQK